MVPRTLLSYALLASFLASPSRAEAQPPYLLEWGGPVAVVVGSEGSRPGFFRNPWYLAVDSDGDVYVSDRDNDRVQKFDADGNYLTEWGGFGSDPGTFGGIDRIAIHPDGRVFVHDRQNGGRIQIFDTEGNLIEVWDLWVGIVIDAAGHIYMIHDEAPFIRKHDADLNPLSAWGFPGAGEGEFVNLGFVESDADGNIYAQDGADRSIEVFDGDGNFLRSLSLDPDGQGAINYEEITFDQDGNILALDVRNHRVHQFTSTGTLLDTWGTGSPSVSPGDFSLPTDIASAQDGRFHVADTFNDRIQIIGVPRGGHFESPAGVAAEAAGHVYVADRNGVQKFDADGNFVTMWGAQGSEPGEFANPFGLAVHPGGNVFVADTYNNRIQAFSEDGVFLNSWGTGGGAPGQFIFPQGIAVDAGGSIYVSDTWNNRIQKFDASGTFLAAWGTAGAGPGQLAGPAGLVVDDAGGVYVVDSGNHRVQKFDANGAFILEWGSRGTANGEFEFPTDVFVDRNGDVFVVDGFNSRIQMFDAVGNFATQWGSFGEGPGEFMQPTTVSGDGDGNIYVLDAGNIRVQKFRAAVEVISAAFDIRPGSCPNSLNPRSMGVLPTALLGNAAFDVRDVDVSSVRLEQALVPTHVGIEDVTTPVEGTACDCTQGGADGFDDLTLKFATQEVVEVLGAVARGESRLLTLTGHLLDGTAFEATDCVTIRGNNPLVLPPRGGVGFALRRAGNTRQHEIDYELHAGAWVRLTVFDVSGRRLERLVDSHHVEGRYTIPWNPVSLARGVYFIKLEAAGLERTHKLVLMAR